MPTNLLRFWAFPKKLLTITFFAVFSLPACFCARSRSLAAYPFAHLLFGVWRGAFRLLFRLWFFGVFFLFLLVVLWFFFGFVFPFWGCFFCFYCGGLRAILLDFSGFRCCFCFCFFWGAFYHFYLISV